MIRIAHADLKTSLRAIPEFFNCPNSNVVALESRGARDVEAIFVTMRIQRDADAGSALYSVCEQAAWIVHLC